MVFAGGVALALLYLGNSAIACGGYLVAFALCRWMGVWWLALAPTAIIAGHCYPWTGSLLVSPGDLLIVAAVANVYFRRFKLSADRSLTGVLLCLLAIVVMGAALGWLTLPASALRDQLDLYLTQLNALYVFKGYLLGTLLAFAYMAEWQNSPEITWDRLTLGMHISSAVVVVLVLVERAIGYGVLDFSHVFRATGPFFSMHIGGQHIDAYWSVALPFLLFANRARIATSHWRTAALVVVQLLSAYAIFVTMSRSTIVLAILLAVAAVVANVVSSDRRNAKKFGTFAAGFTVLTLFVAMWFAGNAVQRRFAWIREDFQTRLDHIRDIRDLTSSTNSFFGGGLGSYPFKYREFNGLSDSVLGMRLDRENVGGTGVLIQPNCEIYLEQIVDVSKPGPWTVQLTYSLAGAATSTEQAIRVIVCEKTLLQSFECVSALPSGSEMAGVTVAANGETTRYLELDLTKMVHASAAPERPLLPRPTTLTVMAVGERPVLLRSLQVVDSGGNNVLRNGDFREGSRFWYFTSDDHLVWRTKNAWLHLRVELGWLGVGIWLTMGAFVAWRLAERQYIRPQIDTHKLSEHVDRERYWIGVTAVLGWLAMSLFGTLLDTPWILQISLLLLAAIAVNRKIA